MSSTTSNQTLTPNVLPTRKYPPRALRPLTLTLILSIPVPSARNPKPPTSQDAAPSRLIRDMPPPLPNSHTDADMLIHLVQSATIRDLGYTWADSTDLLRWLVEELTKRLNHLLDMKVARTTERHRRSGFHLRYQK